MWRSGRPKARSTACRTGGSVRAKRSQQESRGGPRSASRPFFCRHAQKKCRPAARNRAAGGRRSAMYLLRASAHIDARSPMQKSERHPSKGALRACSLGWCEETSSRHRRPDSEIAASFLVDSPEPRMWPEPERISCLTHPDHRSMVIMRRQRLAGYARRDFRTMRYRPERWQIWSKRPK